MLLAEKIVLGTAVVFLAAAVLWTFVLSKLYNRKYRRPRVVRNDLNKGIAIAPWEDWVQKLREDHLWDDTWAAPRFPDDYTRPVIVQKTVLFSDTAVRTSRFGPNLCAGTIEDYNSDVAPCCEVVKDKHLLVPYISNMVPLSRQTAFYTHKGFRSYYDAIFGRQQQALDFSQEVSCWLWMLAVALVIITLILHFVHIAH